MGQLDQSLVRGRRNPFTLSDNGSPIGRKVERRGMIKVKCFDFVMVLLFWLQVKDGHLYSYSFRLHIPVKKNS